MNKSAMEELENRYRELCTILLFLSLTRENGNADEKRHNAAVEKAEAEIMAVCEEIKKLKKGKE